jgi:uncharacterized protein (TIGR02452 family)
MSKKITNNNVPFDMKAASSANPTDKTEESVYTERLNEKGLKIILKYKFDPVMWLQFYEKYSHNPASKRLMRCMVQIGTIDACLRGKYFLPEGEGVNLNKKEMEKISKSTRMYTADNKFKAAPQYDNTVVRVVRGDCLEAALHLKTITIKGKLLNPATLIMASASLPGGGYRSGAGAQEENLHRRTNLFQCLEDPYEMTPNRSWGYPLPEFGGIYVSDAYVLRGSEPRGYPFLEAPQRMSFIAVAAYKSPPTETVNEKYKLSKKIAQHTKKKIQTILNIALDNNHDSIVLGAFGCGAYANPPEHMAELFKEVIQTDFRNCFKAVIFAILDTQSPQDHNPEGNVAPFASVFNTEPIDIDDFIQLKEI